MRPGTPARVHPDRATDARRGRRARPSHRAPTRWSPPTPPLGRRAPRSSGEPPGSPRCRSSRRRAAPPHMCATPCVPAAVPSRPTALRRARVAPRPRRRPRRGAVPNAAWKPSPVVFTTNPACPSIASRTTASCRARAGRIASGCCSQRRVDPSRSVKRNVTVPDGNSLNADSPARPGFRGPVNQTIAHDAPRTAPATRDPYAPGRADILARFAATTPGGRSCLGQLGAHSRSHWPSWASSVSRTRRPSLRPQHQCHTRSRIRPSPVTSRFSDRSIRCRSAGRCRSHTASSARAPTC